MDKLEEIHLSHKLELRRIVIEKVFFGILLLLGALFANVLLEGYKSNEVKERFLIEQRLESAREILSAHSNTTALIYPLLAKICSGDRIEPDDLENILVSARNFQAAINSNTVLFGSDYEDVAHRTLNIHRGFAAVPPGLKCEHRDFLSSITEHFEHQTQAQIGDISTRRIGTAPVPMSKTELDEMGFDAYLQKNLDSWIDR